MSIFETPSAADIAMQISSVPPNVPFGTYQVNDTLGASSASDGSAGNVVTRVFSLTNEAGVSGTITDTYTYGPNSIVNGNPTQITRGNFAAAATSFTTALSASSAIENSSITMTLTPNGSWPASTTLTPAATTVSGTWSPGTITPSGTTPAVFTFTPHNIASGTLSASASPALTSASGAQAFTSTAAVAFTSALSSSTEVVGSGVTLTLTPTTGSWPNTTLTPSASGLTGTWSPTTIVPSGATPAVFTFTPSATGSGTLSASAASVSMANTTGALANTVTAAPVPSTISSAVVSANGTTLTLTFNQAVTLTASDISFTVGGSAVTATNSDAATSSATHVFTMAATVYSGQAVAYTTSSTAFTSPALSTTASGVAATNNSTQTAPTGVTISNVTIGTNGTTVTMALSQSATLANVGDFAISVGGTPYGVTWTAPTTAATSFTGTIATTVTSGQTCAYTTSSTAFTSPALAATGTNVAVTNNSTQTAALPSHYMSASSSGTGTATLNGGISAPTQTLDMRAQVNTSTYDAPGSGNGAILSATNDFGMSLTPGGYLTAVVHMSTGYISSTSSVTIASQVPVSTPVWLRALYSVTAGLITFYTSTDGAAWTQLGSTTALTGTFSTQTPNTGALSIGGGSANPLPSNFELYQVGTLCDGAAKSLAHFTTQASGTTTFVDTYVPSESWTVVSPAVIT